MKILLHICCGVCAIGAAKQLTEEGHTVTGYFFNPNILPPEEYDLRLAASKTVAGALGFPLETGDYDPVKWLAETSHLAGEKEGGARCHLCYRIRLQETYNKMLETGADAFASTLTMGPMKSAVVINKIGNDIGGDKFLPRDFKKKDWIKKANEIARNLNIYRQNYCGCIFSMRKEEKK
jgi:predicted adenine nucleotide alpha hydrolase (AANH) superfamily ATPase